MADPIVLPTAYSHGVDRDTIMFVLANPTLTVPDQGDWALDMFVGPGLDDDLYEVGVEFATEGFAVVIHADVAREQYRLRVREM